MGQVLSNLASLRQGIRLQVLVVLTPGWPAKLLLLVDSL